MWHRSANSTAKRRPGRRRRVRAGRHLSRQLPGAALKIPALAGAAASCAVALDGLEHRQARPSASVNGAQRPGQLVDLIYELLDAHNDTAHLAADLEHDKCWEAHLAYLLHVQRAGRETLAHMSLKEQI
jgi:hypothetical protein